MKIIVGLGNPGRQFAYSRHNVGFMCIDGIAKEWGIKLGSKTKQASLGQGEFASQPVVLAKPRTFMNLSGEGVNYLLTRFGAKPDDLLVIYDDLDLPLGKIRIRPGGSSAGHNGIKSIILRLRTEEFPRVRVGIGRPQGDADEVSYVLGTFSSEEKVIIEETIKKVAEAVSCLLQEGIQGAMNRFN